MMRTPINPLLLVFALRTNTGSLQIILIKKTSVMITWEHTYYGEIVPIPTKWVFWFWKDSRSSGQEREKTTSVESWQDWGDGPDISVLKNNGVQAWHDASSIHWHLHMSPSSSCFFFNLVNWISKVWCDFLLYMKKHQKTVQFSLTISVQGSDGSW